MWRMIKCYNGTPVALISHWNRFRTTVCHPARLSCHAFTDIWFISITYHRVWWPFVKSRFCIDSTFFICRFAPKMCLNKIQSEKNCQICFNIWLFFRRFLLTVLFLFTTQRAHRQTDSQSRTVWSCQNLLEPNLSNLPPGCSLKSHSSDGLHLPIWGNHLQPNKSSEGTFTTCWCNCASWYYTIVRAAQHCRGTKTVKNAMQNILNSLHFAEYSDFDKLRFLQSCLCSIYLWAPIKGLKDELRNIVILEKIKDYCWQAI